MNRPRKWLAKIRNENGLTQKEVADEAEIDRSFYTQIESGLRNPSVDTAKKLAHALRFDWTLFFDKHCGERQPNPKSKSA